MSSPTQQVPYLDFYASHGIIPTRQDIGDLGKHLERRHALYRHLGLPPGAFRHASVLEFGPGSGHNAIATAQFGPRRYLLVDGNTPSVESTHRLLKEHCPTINCELVQSSILEFSTEERFDVVTCEAVIPTQNHPPSFLRHVSKFVKPGGVLIFTCVDSVSVLSEMLRRWLAWGLVKEIENFDQKVKVLVEFFKQDMAWLPGMSRRPEDWVIDQLLHPWIGPLFSIPEAIDALGTSAVVLGSSPRFLTDWRWYKDIVEKETFDNEFARHSYYVNGINLIDFRIRVDPIPLHLFEYVVQSCKCVYNSVFRQEHVGVSFEDEYVTQHLVLLEKALQGYSVTTCRSIRSIVDYFQSGRSDDLLLSDFRKWWGRGQQYLSCVMC